MKKTLVRSLTCVVLALCMLVALVACGGPKTVEDFVNSKIVQDQVKEFKSQLEDSGMDIDVKGEGDKLVYSFTISDLDGVDKDLLGTQLSSALDSMASTFEGIATELAKVVTEGNPSVVVEYVTSDGEVLASKEFSAK